MSAVLVGLRQPLVAEHLAQRRGSESDLILHHAAKVALISKADVGGQASEMVFAVCQAVQGISGRRVARAVGSGTERHPASEHYSCPTAKLGCPSLLAG
jgi:hypothetical protein